jgi:hypothetical protein
LTEIYRNEPGLILKPEMTGDETIETIDDIPRKDSLAIQTLNQSTFPAELLSA